jgi:pyroglutamyl-peptidase
MKSTNKSIILVIFILYLLSNICNGLIAVSFESNILNENNNQIVLVTGFGPFGNNNINPSQYISENLSGIIIKNASIIGLTLTVDYNESINEIVDALEKYDPILIISLGLAASYKSIEVEKLAINLKRIEKDKWPYYQIKLINPEGPPFRMSNLPSVRIVKEVRNQNIPIKTSLYGGIYICNALQYNLLGYIEDNRLRTRAGFIHVPLLKSQSPDGLELQDMIHAITIAIEESLDYIYMHPLSYFY